MTNNIYNRIRETFSTWENKKKFEKRLLKVIHIIFISSVVGPYYIIWKGIREGVFRIERLGAWRTDIIVVDPYRAASYFNDMSKFTPIVIICVFCVVMLWADINRYLDGFWKVMKEG